MQFKMRLWERKIHKWADRCSYDDEVPLGIVSSAQKRGYLTVIRAFLVLLLLSGGTLVPAGAQTGDDGPPLIVILTETGRTRDALPVLTRHPQPDADLQALLRGYSGRLLRLYRLEQQFLAREHGRAIEPAYLLRSSNEGGFPRVGFYLDDTPKPDVAYVDLHHRSQPSGRFAAVDQIFPHELLHVIVQHLAGEPPEGGANQVHAIGVRTDPVVAFNEGFAEHAQLMAVDDPDAPPDTRALKGDTGLVSLANREMAAYARALSARWSIATRSRLGFPLWFSQTEQIWRYHAVKANVFAHEAGVPARLLSAADPYLAYLYENTIPGDASLPIKSTGRLVSTEGFVSALMYRWVLSPDLQGRFRDNRFYEAFGVARSTIDPIDNVYLKLFAVMALHKPHDLVSLVRAYVRAFEDEATSVDALLRDNGLVIPAALPPDIWLESTRLRTGTTLFDQYRAMPRPHTFDLNAASQVDLLGIPGVTPELARAIQQAAPFSRIDDVARVQGVTPKMFGDIQLMVAEMRRSRASALKDRVSMDPSRILRPIGLRAGVWLVAAAIAGALGYRLVRRQRPVRLALNGLAAAFVALAVAWVFVSAPWQVLAAPAIVFGVPGAAWSLVRRRSWAEAARVMGGWLAAAAPAWLISQPLF